MKYLFLLVPLLSTHVLTAQNQVAVFDLDVNPGQVIRDIKLPPPKTEGNVYLDDNWHFGNFAMNGTPLYEGFQLRYDLQHQNLEIKVDGQIKVCVVSILDEFYFIGKSTTLNSHFISLNNIENSFIIGHKGIVKILVDDKVKLYKNYFLETQKANYSPTTDTGSRNNKIIKKSSYYLDDNNTIVKLSTSLKKSKAVFGTYFSKVEKYAKKNKLKLKNEQEMIALVNYYNTLLSK